MGECRGAMPHCRGCGGVPHKHTGRVGGKNYVRQEQLRKGLLKGEGWDEGAPLPQVYDKECNEMQPNATELKVSPLLVTPDEANQGRNQGQLAHRLRVSGGPNEATVASFPASPLGVNEGQTGPNGARVHPLPCRSRADRTSYPCPPLDEQRGQPTPHEVEMKPPCPAPALRVNRAKSGQIGPR